MRGSRGMCGHERRGLSDGTARGRARANGLTFSCPACDGLVDLRAASEAAGRDDRKHLRTGDGCFRCGSHYRPGKHCKAQRDKVQAILEGGRIMIAAPARIDEREQIEMLSAEEAQEHVRRAIASLPRRGHA